MPGNVNSGRLQLELKLKEPYAASIPNCSLTATTADEAI